MLKMLLLVLLALTTVTEMPTPEGLIHPDPLSATSLSLQG